MNIRPIRTKKDYTTALKRMEKLWGTKLGTPEGDELDVLASLVDKYEEDHFPIDTPDPIDAIRYIMEEREIDRQQLSEMLGHKSKVSEVLNRKRVLSKSMICALHDRLGIPYEVLMG